MVDTLRQDFYQQCVPWPDIANMLNVKAFVDFMSEGARTNDLNSWDNSSGALALSWIRTEGGPNGGHEQAHAPSVVSTPSHFGTPKARPQVRCALGRGLFLPCSCRLDREGANRIHTHKMFQARHDALDQACNEVVADLRRAETQARCTLQVVHGELNADRLQKTKASGPSFNEFAKVIPSWRYSVVAKHFYRGDT